MTSNVMENVHSTDTGDIHGDAEPQITETGVTHSDAERPMTETGVTHSDAERQITKTGVTHSDAEHQESETGVRHRVPTAKGLEFEVNVKRDRLRKSVSKWRKQATTLETVLSDSGDTRTLQRERDLLVRHMRTVSESAGAFLLINTDEVPIDLETIESEHYDLVKRVNVRVSELVAETGSNYSHGRGSAGSIGSRRSNSSLKQETAARAAELEVKLEYLQTSLDSHIESRRRELNEFHTGKELAIARARLKAMTDVDNEYSDFSNALSKLPYDSGRAEQFVRGMSFSDARAHNVPVNRDKPQAEKVTTSNPIPKTSKPMFASGGQGLNPNASVFQQNNYIHVPEEGERDSVFVASVPAPQIELSNKIPVQTGDNLMLQTIASLVDHLSISRLPPPEPGVFTGDPLHYASWKSAFETLIENRKIEPSEKIHYLKKYLGGNARECVEGYFLLSTEDAYSEAKHKLATRFGDPFVLGRAFLDTLEKWPQVPSRDGISLRKYLSQCETAMKKIGSLNVLNDDREVQKLQHKLPEWLSNRWSRVVWEHKHKYGQFPAFAVFVGFVVKEADIMCDPATSTQYSKGTYEKNTRTKSVESSRQVFASSASTSDSELKSETDAKPTMENKQRKWLCVLCKSDHHISKCSNFLNKSLDDRWTYVKGERLCFSCLNPKHIVQNCKFKFRCKKCQRLHSPLLHRDSDPPREDQVTIRANSLATNYTGLGEAESSGSSMIVPVYVSHGDDLEREMLVYALLDAQSDTTFILEDTCDKLRVSGPDVQLILSTMSVKDEVVSTCKISDLYVRGYKSEERIKLPAAYTRPGIPASRTHIPTPDTARQWPHLEKIAQELVPLQDVNVGLLIGYNCTQALVPREVIPSPNNEPYGQRTSLGWGIVGIAGKKMEELALVIGL